MRNFKVFFFGLAKYCIYIQRLLSILWLNLFSFPAWQKLLKLHLWLGSRYREVLFVGLDVQNSNSSCWWYSFWEISILYSLWPNDVSCILHFTHQSEKIS